MTGGLLAAGTALAGIRLHLWLWLWLWLWLRFWWSKSYLETFQEAVLDGFRCSVDAIFRSVV